MATPTSQDLETAIAAAKGILITNNSNVAPGANDRIVTNANITDFITLLTLSDPTQTPVFRYNSGVGKYQYMAFFRNEITLSATLPITGTAASPSLWGRFTTRIWNLFHSES